VYDLYDNFPRVVLGKESRLIGQICPICREYFLFGERLCLIDRKGTYAHDDCVCKNIREEKENV